MIINLPSQTDLSGFYVVFEGSTNIEEKGNFGISHLMEHLLCKNFDHLQDEFDMNGIDWNAYTSANEIVFHLTGLDEKLNLYKENFTDMLCDFSNISHEDFEKERNIVLQEYFDSFNDQTSSHYLNLERKILNHYNPIGLKEDLENLKFMDCINFFEKQFQNPTKIINVSKDTPYNNSIIEFNKPQFTTNYKLNESAKNDVPFEIMNDFKGKTSLCMMSPMIEGNNAHVHFLNACLGGGLNSPLYQEIREKKGLVYYVSCYQSRMNESGITSISTLTTDENVEPVIECVNDIFNNIDDHLTKERFNIVKEQTKVNLKKSDINRYGNVNRWINPQGWNVSDIIDDVTYDDVMETFENNYKMDNFYISNDKTEFTQKDEIV
jgi:predicted Zn-dependent peptidase